MPVYRKNLFGPLSPVAFLGPGLIGGSLALRLRETFPDSEIRIWARSPGSAIAAADAVGGNSLGTDDLRAVVEGAMLAVICLPVEAMGAVCAGIVDDLPEGAVVTDVGSVKARVVQELEPLFGGRFLGAHPMAGSERSGFDAAFSGLFQNAPCILTPTPQTSPETMAIVKKFWECMGCRILKTTPEEHDHIVARTSHLPHLMASVLAAGILPGDENFSGSGLRDTTRVAMGPAGMWADILLSNRDALLQNISRFSGKLGEFRAALEAGDESALKNLLSQSAQIRSSLSPSSSAK